VEALTTEIDLGVLAITHYRRLLAELRADHVHVLVKGQIVQSGGPELVEVLEERGYAAFSDGDDVDDVAETKIPDDPFADPLA